MGRFVRITPKIQKRLASAVQFVTDSKHPVTAKELADVWCLAPEYVALFLNEAVDQGALFSDTGSLPHLYSAKPLKPRAKAARIPRRVDTLYADLATRLNCSPEEAQKRLLDLLVPRLQPRS